MLKKVQNTKEGIEHALFFCFSAFEKLLLINTDIFTMKAWCEQSEN